MYGLQPTKGDCPSKETIRVHTGRQWETQMEMQTFYFSCSYWTVSQQSLRSRLTGKSKEDVENGISTVEVLAVKLSQKEGELIQEKFEVKKLVNFLKQASEDAKKLVGQEKSFVCAKIKSARAVVQRFGEALEEEERNSKSSKKQDFADLMEEVQEARRIKLLHQPSKVMDMELELHALRIQIREKSVFSFKLQKELTMSKRVEENRSLRDTWLLIQPRSANAPALSRCTVQWFRLSCDGSQQDVISGATTPSYAPEPLDVGRVLQVEISLNGKKDSVTTLGSIEPTAGQDSYVETLMRKSHAGFSLCGVRSDSSDAAKRVFWQARKGLSFVLTFASEREWNAAIMIARKYVLDSNAILAGPHDTY